MNTPICDFVRNYAAANPVRLHMPGHKGECILGCESADLTEITGADVLYHPEGIILESEQNAAGLFGTRRTVFSTEGSSLCIRAMLYLAAQDAIRRGKRPRIAAGRNAHKVFLTASALLDLDIVWIYPEHRTDLVSCAISPERLDSFLESCAEPPTAVYITSPDYLGSIADIRGYAEVCRRRGCLLLVDNAHGAYLQFLPESLHPMALGADLCCDSAHKTLPVLTGGAYLHISKAAPCPMAEEADAAMALFSSTSPSYLILQSLDRANAELAAGFPSKLRDAAAAWKCVRQHLEKSGYRLMGQEPLKLTILPKSRGYTGEELGRHLEANGFFYEFTDPDHLVLMLPVMFSPELPERLTELLLRIPPKPPICECAPVIAPAEQVYTPRQALFLPSREVAVRDGIGKIMASPTVSCPPAIPPVACGERITAEAVQVMEYYGIRRIRVLE